MGQVWRSETLPRNFRQLTHAVSSEILKWWAIHLSVWR